MTAHARPRLQLRASRLSRERANVAPRRDSRAGPTTIHEGAGPAAHDGRRPWVQDMPAYATRPEGIRRGDGPSNEAPATTPSAVRTFPGPSVGGPADSPRRSDDTAVVHRVRIPALPCRETGHIRSAAGCSGVAPRHRGAQTKRGVSRAVLDVHVSAEGESPCCRVGRRVLRPKIGTRGKNAELLRRSAQLEQGGEAWSSRRAHNAEFAGSNPAPAIDRPAERRGVKLCLVVLPMRTPSTRRRWRRCKQGQGEYCGVPTGRRSVSPVITLEAEA